MKKVFLIFAAILFLPLVGGADFAVVSTPTNKADILIVVDDSESMIVYQKNLANNMKYLLADFEEVEFQVGILTTSVYRSGPRQPPEGFVSGSLLGSAASGNFAEIVSVVERDLMVGTRGSTRERPFEAVMMALSKPLIENENKGFLRPGVPLYIVFVTDSDDQSEGTVADFTVDLVNAKGDSDIHVTSYLANQPGSTCRGESSESPERIINLTKAFDGAVYNLCDENWLQNKIILKN